jgi:hypothetical protein
MPIYKNPLDAALYQQGYNWACMGFELTNLAYCLLESKSFVNGYNNFVNQRTPIYDNTVEPLVIYNPKVKHESRRISNR